MFFLKQLLLFIASSLFWDTTNAYLGPINEVTLINSTVLTNNTSGSEFILEYYVFTDGYDKAEIYMNSYFTFTGTPPEGSTLYFGTMIEQEAGVALNFDAGICKTVFKKEQKAQTPEVLDIWITGELYLKQNQQWLLEQLEIQQDAKEDGQVDWQFYNEQPWDLQVQEWLRIDKENKEDPSKSKYTFVCPVRRVLNTGDYKDIKIEILLHYEVMALYIWQLPDEDPAKPTFTMMENGNGFSYPSSIQIKDASYYGMKYSVIALIALAFHAW